jgi:hypothetical protein
MQRTPVPTGTRLTVAATGNVLVDRRLLGDDPFDAIHFLDRAEDTDCFLRLSRSGATIVWAEEATVLEPVPLERQTVHAMGSRAFRDGRAWSRVERRYEPGLTVRMHRGARAIAHVGVGVGRTVAGALTGRRARLADGVNELATGVGQLVGLTGRRPPPR